jgi:hypothetical protein
MDRKTAPFAAGDRVRLVKDHAELKAGAVGAITRHGTIKREISISPDASGERMYVVFDGVIGTMTIPRDLLDKLSG